MNRIRSHVKFLGELYVETNRLILFMLEASLYKRHTQPKSVMDRQLEPWIYLHVALIGQSIALSVKRHRLILFTVEGSLRRQ